MSRVLTRSALAVVAILSVLLLAAPPGLAARPTPAKQATAVGAGGAAASVDPIATMVAIDILRRGRRWIHGPLQRARRSRAHARWAGDGAGGVSARQPHRPNDREADPVS